MHSLLGMVFAASACEASDSEIAPLKIIVEKHHKFRNNRKNNRKN
jgi:hypothetical protein